jgi:WD40 repeat protein
LRGLGRYVASLSFSRDGRLLAAGGDWGVLQIWDVRKRMRLHTISIEGADVSRPAFSPDGKLVAVGTYGSGEVWVIDVRTGQIRDHQKISDIGCGSVAFSPDGRYLVTPSTGGLITWPYDVGGTIRVFRVGAH